MFYRVMILPVLSDSNLEGSGNRQGLIVFSLGQTPTYQKILIYLTVFILIFRPGSPFIIMLVEELWFRRVFH
jgi:hypothetical protein